MGIVTAKMDRTITPNAENLSFAANATLFSRSSGWEFVSEGQQHLTDYQNALKGEKSLENKAD
jgi:hypothetical protein